MAKRESGTSDTKRVATPAQRAALAAGRAKRDQINKRKREHPEEKSNDDRWAALLSGTITVKDLDDKELKKLRVRNKAGGFAGTHGRVWPSHLLRAAEAERHRRLNDRVRGLGPLAAKRMRELLEDPDTKPEVQARLIALALDRSLGKVPETVRVEGGRNGWEDLVESGLLPEGVDRDSLLVDGPSSAPDSEDSKA